MYTLIIVIHVVACLFLIATILLQSGKGGGLAGLFGGGGTSQTIFGARASTFLTRATTAAAVGFLLTCITLTVLSSRKGKSLLEGKRALSEEVIEEALIDEPILPEPEASLE